MMKKGNVSECLFLPFIVMQTVSTHLQCIIKESRIGMRPAE